MQNTGFSMGSVFYIYTKYFIVPLVYKVQSIYFFCGNPFSKWSTAAFSCASSPFKTASGSL